MYTNDYQVAFVGCCHLFETGTLTTRTTLITPKLPDRLSHPNCVIFLACLPQNTKIKHCEHDCTKIGIKVYLFSFPLTFLIIILGFKAFRGWFWLMYSATNIAMKIVHRKLAKESRGIGIG